ncbi:hypothetical protein ACI8AA_23100 [Geodermatophilus sp. SYSU D01180]
MSGAVIARQGGYPECPARTGTVQPDTSYAVLRSSNHYSAGAAGILNALACADGALTADVINGGLGRPEVVLHLFVDLLEQSRVTRDDLSRTLVKRS